MLIHPKDVPNFDVPQDPEICETSHHSDKKKVEQSVSDVDVNNIDCVIEHRECTESSVHSVQTPVNMGDTGASTCERTNEAGGAPTSTDTKRGSILKPLASLWSFVNTLNITPTDINTRDMEDLESFLPTL